MHIQSDSDEQTGVRAQRDKSWKPLAPYWRPAAMDGKDLTLKQMPDEVKVQLVNAMAHEPACWPATVTLAKTETKVSSWRCDAYKKLNSKAKQASVWVRVCA